MPVDCPFEILPHLPPYGPLAEAFSATGLGTHGEGFVVRFHPSEDESWVGNFQGGGTGYEGVVEHPNGTHLIVLACGQGYVVDPRNRKFRGYLAWGIQDVIHVPELNALVFGNGLEFEALGAKGQLWRSKRISWDEMRELTKDGLALAGESSSLDNTWIPFRLDLRTGSFTGGSYNGPPNAL